VAGAIGYVEFAYAKQNKLTHTQLQNADKVFVEPSDDAFKAAAAGADWSKSAFYEILTNQPGKSAWPISGATFILLHKVQDKPAQAVETMKFFDWAYANGDQLATDLEYVPLPDSVVRLIRASWGANIKDGSGKALWTSK
jgi:phosphate transport system substrate-binding protein